MDFLCGVANLYQNGNEYWVTIKTGILPSSPKRDLPLVEFLNEYEELTQHLPKGQRDCLISVASQHAIPIIEKEVPQKFSNWLFVLQMLHMSILFAANIMSVEVMHVFGIDIVAGAICFPLIYSISAMVVELFGLEQARKIILFSILGNLIFALLLQAAVLAPSAATWHNQVAFEMVLSMSRHVFIGSMVALLFGELICSYVLAWIKNHLPKVQLYMRLLFSSFLGILIDSSIFLMVIQFNSITSYSFINMLTSVLFHKFSYEALSSLLVCSLIKYLRKHKPEVRYQPLRLRFKNKDVIR